MKAGRLAQDVKKVSHTDRNTDTNMQTACRYFEPKFVPSESKGN